MALVLDRIESCKEFVSPYRFDRRYANPYHAHFPEEQESGEEAAPPKKAASPAVPLEQQFNELAAKWKRETRNQSAISAIVMHPAYLEILGIGKDAVPWILRDLRKENNHWFTALRAITKTTPVQPEDAGNLNKMRKAWLRWGKENGYLD